MPPRSRRKVADIPPFNPPEEDLELPADPPEAVPLRIPQVMVDPLLLVPHPKNPKLHDDAWIAESLTELGQVSPVIVNQGTMTGRPMELLSGHGTTANWIRTHPGELIQVSLLDVGEEEGLRIMLAMNPNPNDPGYDIAGLAGVLTVLAESAKGLVAVGYKTDDLETLQRITDATSLPGETNPLDEWWDMPGHLEQVEGVTPARKMIVAFASDEDRDKFAAVIGQTFTEKTRAIWFPPRANLPSSAYRAVGVEATEAQVVAVETAGQDPVAEPDADGFMR